MAQEWLRTPALDGFHCACILFVYCKQYFISIYIKYICFTSHIIYIYTLCTEVFRDVLSHQWSKTYWADWRSRSMVLIFHAHYVRNIRCEIQYTLLMLPCSRKFSVLGYGRLSVHFLIYFTPPLHTHTHTHTHIHLFSYFRDHAY